MLSNKEKSKGLKVAKQRLKLRLEGKVELICHILKKVHLKNIKKDLLKKVIRQKFDCNPLFQ